jgi:hypothetical protein
MKLFFYTAVLILLASVSHAQHIYQIRADSVRIYSDCDTAELILENRTKDVSGFLFNKGKGRTEFRKMTDTMYQSGNTIVYRNTTGNVVSVPVVTSSNETLESVRTRGNLLNGDVWFTAGTGNPSPGFHWGYNTDEWGIYVESPQNTPSGNMIISAGDDDTEGWIFRHNGYQGTNPIKDVVSLGVDRFKYLGNDVYHKGNLDAGLLVKGGVYENNPSFNSLTTNSFLGSTNGVTNAPITGEAWWNIISTRHRNGAADGSNWGMQIAQGMYDFTNRIFFRSQRDGTWNNWKEFWHSGNVTFATSGADVALKTNTASNLVLGSGAVYAAGFFQSSMRSLKKDIHPFEANATDILKKVNVRTFIYKADSANIKHIGFIADEVPDEMASPAREGVDQANTIALLVKALQEMNTKVQALEQTVNELKKQVAEKK